MNTVEENFKADKIKAAIDYLEFKGELNKIKAEAIEEFSNTLTEPMDYRLTYRTLNELLSEHANKLRGE